jgi:hypothetical protein
MADSGTSWTPPPVPGSTAAPTGTQNAPPDDTPQWMKDLWDSFIYDNQSIGIDAQWLWGKLNPPDPEQDVRDLASKIYEKMGPGGPAAVNAPHAPDKNYLIALQAAQAAQRDPNYRQQLVTAMGWNVNNPHVAYWVKNGGGVPSDPTGSGLAPGQAAPPSAAPAAAAPAATAGAPFDPKAYGGRANDPGFTYGAALP